MIKAQLLKPFEPYRTRPPVIMPEQPRNQKKGSLYSVLAPSIDAELSFLSSDSGLKFRYLSKYFIPKRWQVSLYGQGNKIFKLNADGEITEKITAAKNGATQLKQIDGVTSYLPVSSSRPMRNLNVLYEINYITETMLGNPKDRRLMAVKAKDIISQLETAFQSTELGNKNNCLGEYPNRIFLIPISLWINPNDLANPDAVMKKNSKNFITAFLNHISTINNLKKFGTVMLYDSGVVMMIDAAQVDPKNATQIHDAIIQFLRKVYLVRNKKVAQYDVEEAIDEKDQKEEAELAEKERETKEEVLADEVLSKANVDTSTVPIELKKELAAKVSKSNTQTANDKAPSSTDDVAIIQPEELTGQMNISSEEADLIMAAKMENKSVASQKRNEMLKTKYKTLKIGNTSLGDLEEAEKKYEVKPVETKSRTINPSLKTLRTPALEKSYNENLAQQDLVSILLHFSTIEPPVYLNKDIKISDVSTPTDRMIRYDVEYEDGNRKRHRFHFLMPKIYKDRYIYLNDQEMNIGHQKFPFPVTKVSANKCQLVTNYNKVFTERYGANVSPRITKLKKVLTTGECSKIATIESGDCTILNKNELTTVELDELGSIITRLTIGKLNGIMTKFYFIIQDARAIISENMVPKAIVSVSYDTNGDEIRKKSEDTSLYPLAIQKDKKTNKTKYFFLSGISNRIYDQTGTDYGELSEFIMNLLIEADEHVSELFDNVSTGTKFVYARSTIMSEDMPTILACAAADPGGLQAVLTKAKIKYTFTEKRPRVNTDTTGVIPFSDGYLVYDRYPYENSLLLNGLLVCPTKEFSIYEMGSRDTYVTIFDIMYNRRTLIDGIENFYYLEIDPITKDVLNRLNMPTDFTTLMIYCVGTLADNSFQIDSDYHNSRVRSLEIINAFLYKALADAWGKWRTERAEKFSIPERAVIRALMECQLVDPHSKLNVTLEAENDTLVKLKGPVGMNEDHSFTIEKRAYHPSMLGLVAMNSIASGEVGIGRHLTVNANIDDARGFLTVGKDDYDGTELSSPGELLYPFTGESSDIERLAMAISQAKHLVPVADQSSGLVSFDMERTIPYTSQDFSFCAKQDGKVVEIKDDVMIIQYADGTYDDINLAAHPDANVDGGFYIMNQMETKMKVGQKFKKNDILAIDPKYINSNDMFGDPTANTGCLARVMLVANGGVFEDSGFITDGFAHRMATKITRQKRVKLSKFANIKYMVKPGDHVTANDPLLTFDDTEDEFSSQLLATIADEQGDEDEIIATNAPVITKVTGVVRDIFIYRTVPMEELTPSVRKIVEQYNKKENSREKLISKYRNISDANTIPKTTEQLVPDYAGKIKGTNVGDGIMIDFYIEYEDVMAPGDKASGSALKSIISFVIPQDLAPYTDFNPERPIDLAIASVGMYKRMCLDFLKVGGLTKFMIEMKRLHRNKYQDRIKAELKKLK